MILYLILGIICFLIVFFWLSGFIYGAPYQASSTLAARKIIKISGVKKGQKVAELGSGNGKLVIEFARKGAIVTGFEINPLLVWVSRWKIRRLGLQKNAIIKQENFWNVSLSKFDIVSVFQVWHVMPHLEKKMKKEMRKGTKVVSNTWKLRGMKPTRKDGHVFLYKF